MTTPDSKGPPRPLTPRELAGLIRTFRELRQWSQETLAALSGLSVRTIQRVEKGEPSDLDTRRALAGAFDSEDLDLFNKPWNIPTPEELKSAQEEFEREHLILGGELGLRRCQRHASLHRRRQVADVVLDDPGERGGPQDDRRLWHRISPTLFGAAAEDAHRAIPPSGIRQGGGSGLRRIGLHDLGHL